jgi:hypothetical protein
MHSKRLFPLAVVAVLSAGWLTCDTAAATDKVTIGLNIALTGARQASGVSTKEGVKWSPHRGRLVDSAYTL